MSRWKLVQTFIWRYAFSRGNRHRSAAVAIILLLAVGMLALVTMMGLMQSLQQEKIVQLRSIESFHIEMSLSDEGDGEDLLERVKASSSNITHAYRFFDLQTLLEIPHYTEQFTFRLRAVEDSFLRDDNPFTQLVALTPTEGPFLLASTQVRNTFRLQHDSPLKLTFLRSGKTATLAPFSTTLNVSGFYYSPLQEFDSTTIIADYGRLDQERRSSQLKIGIFVKNPSARSIAKSMSALQRAFPEATILSWQNLHDALYSALLLEKTLLYLFLLSIFIIVGVSIRNASSRLIHHKLYEVAILRSLGADTKSIVTIFLGSTLVITLIGCLLGLVFGIFVVNNISNLFQALNTVRLWFHLSSSPLLLYPFQISISYLEISLALLFVFAIAIGNSYLGLKRLVRYQPLEILYHA